MVRSEHASFRTQILDSNSQPSETQQTIVSENLRDAANRTALAPAGVTDKGEIMFKGNGPVTVRGEQRQCWDLDQHVREGGSFGADNDHAFLPWATSHLIPSQRCRVGSTTGLREAWRRIQVTL